MLNLYTVAGQTAGAAVNESLTTKNMMESMKLIPNSRKENLNKLFKMARVCILSRWQ